MSKIYESGLDSLLDKIYNELKKESPKRAENFRKKCFEYKIRRFCAFMRMDLDQFRRMFKAKKTQQRLIRIIKWIYQGNNYHEGEKRILSRRVSFQGRKLII